MKLSSLTPEQKTRLLAELDGYNNVIERPKHWWLRVAEFTGSRNGIQLKIPSYLTSYDAIIPLIQKLPRKVRVLLAVQLSTAKNSTARIFDLFDKTPSQLCDAVLVATGKAEL